MRKLGSRRWNRDYSCGWKSVLFCSSSAHWDREWECEQERPPGFQPPVGCRLPSCSLPLSSTGPANGGDHGDMSRRAILGSRAEHLPLLQIYLQPSDSTYLCSLLQWVLGPRPRGSWIALSFPPRGPSGPTAFWYLRREWWKEMYDMTHPFTPWSFCSGHTGLLALSWTCCVLSCLSTYAFVVVIYCNAVLLILSEEYPWYAFYNLNCSLKYDWIDIIPPLLWWLLGLCAFPVWWA